MYMYFVTLQSKKKTLSKDISGKISKIIPTDTSYRQEQKSREHWENRSQTQQEQTFSCKQEDEEDEKLDTMDVVRSFINVDALN